MRGKCVSLLLMLALLVAWSGALGAAASPSPRSNLGPAAQPGTEADVAIAVVRQDCAGYGGPYPCFTSLAEWQANYGGIDFGANPPGDLVAADKIAVAQIEGAWTQPDTAPLEITGWNTDAAHYIRIYTTAEARHQGTPGSGYRLEIATPTSQPLYSDVAYLRIEGLEIYSNSAYDGHVIYLRPGTPAGLGEIHFSHNLIHGDGVNSASGIYNYDCDGTLGIWNNIIYDVGNPGYTAGIQSGAGTAYVYNNTIVDIISGFAIRSGGTVVAKNNLTEAPGDDFYGSFYLGSDFNASSDNTAPGFHSRRNQTFTFVNPAGYDFHLAAADAGARNYGLDLSSDPYLVITDDIDGFSRSGGWDIGADEEPTAPDTIPPARLDGAPSGTLPPYTTETMISLATSEVSTCHYSTTAGLAFTDMTGSLSTTAGLSHTATVTGLVEEQTYVYYVKCQDVAGNANPDDYAISFYIASSDAVPPVISNVQATSITPYSAHITWATDEDSTSQVEYGPTDAYGKITVLSATRVISHAVALLGLDPSSTYHFRVRSQDIAYNEAVSADGTFATAALTQFFYVNQSHPAASDANPGTEDLPWKTIQHAADVAQPGDTILVYPGTYTRTTIQHGGTAGHYITFKGLNVPDQSLVDPGALFDPQNPVQIPGNPAVNAVCRGFHFSPVYGSGEIISYVRIENFEVTDIHHEEVSGQGGIDLGDTDHVEIVGNFLHDLNPDPDSYGYTGIRGSNHNNVDIVVRGNTLYRCQGTGISLVGRDWIVEDNAVSHSLDANTDTGTEVGGDSDAVRFFGSGHIIRNNYLHDNLDTEQIGSPHIDCFQTFSVYPDSQFAFNILIEGNYCRNMGQMLMIEDSSEENGTGNAVHDITFRNNIFQGARAYAINGGWADHFVFANNVIAESFYGGLGLTHNPYLTVMNNIFYNNGSGSQIIDQDSKVGTVWDYNIHFPDFSWPPKQPEYDQHSMFGVDPRFLDPSAGNFHLWANSPAIDRGAALIEFNYDKEAVIRPQGAAWDIGAYEALPPLVLAGVPGDQTIHLLWQVNTTLPASSTWRIAYEGIPGSEPSPIGGLISPTRAYTLTGLTNFTWYTVTLNTMLGTTPFLTDTARVMPTDISVYLPIVWRGD